MHFWIKSQHNNNCFRFCLMKWILIFQLLLLTFIANGQSRPFDNNNFGDETEEIIIDPDSIDYESYTEKTSSFKALFSGKPGKAIMYGMLIPGGGQMYNKKYWKVPIALVAETAGVATFIIVRREYNYILKQYEYAINDIPSNGYRGVTSSEQINNYRRVFQKYSEQAGVLMIVVHIIVAVEAYIDRHLIDFDINEDLSFDLKLPDFNSQPYAGIKINYNLNHSTKKNQPKVLYSLY